MHFNTELTKFPVSVQIGSLHVIRQKFQSELAASSMNASNMLELAISNSQVERVWTKKQNGSQGWMTFVNHGFNDDSILVLEQSY